MCRKHTKFVSTTIHITYYLGEIKQTSEGKKNIQNMLLLQFCMH